MSQRSECAYGALIDRNGQWRTSDLRHINCNFLLILGQILWQLQSPTMTDCDYSPAKGEPLPALWEDTYLYNLRKSVREHICSLSSSFPRSPSGGRSPS